MWKPEMFNRCGSFMFMAARIFRIFKGTIFFKLLFWVDKEILYGYQHVYTPVVANVSLYKTSGHLELYKEDMFPIMQL
ncbi:MAG: hypothetical protein Q8877_02545, partial [Sweet potato little leaf phytoplasma]|nr:hypothetical protein [Sweet potato little leaf phytoplasma]